ncbi:MAG: fused response regulator/phosphatase [Spirochaetales bacterium]|nr:fused response regulator/phosphatase [Spirochaetales bacterium]
MGVKEQHINLLLVEDNLGDARLIREAISETELINVTITHVERLSELKKTLATQTFDMIILDLTLPDASGLETVRYTAEYAQETAIIVLTGLNDGDLAIRAVQEGAQDYLIKGDVNASVLERVIIYAIERNQTHLRISSLSKQLANALSEINYELEISANIQRKIIQEKIPEEWGKSIGLYYSPAAKMGGDLYDIKTLPGGETSFIVADGSGHSVHAALLAIMFKLSLQHQIVKATGPKSLIKSINDELQPLFLDNMFFTAFCAWYDPAKKNLTYTSAGHPEQYLLTKDGKDLISLKNNGIPLCIYDDTSYEQSTVGISRGDRLFLFTDGMYERFDKEGKKLGEEGLQAFIMDNRKLSVENLKRKVVEKVANFNMDSVKDDSIFIVIEF